MSEWLTAGQMIDRLKVGEVAEGRYESESGKTGFVFKVKRTENKLKNITNWDGNVALDNTFFGAKWRILANYVSFEEAMKSLKEGKRIVSWTNGDYETPYNAYKIDYTVDQEISINEILYAKWTIEGE